MTLRFGRLAPALSLAFAHAALAERHRDPAFARAVEGVDVVAEMFRELDENHDGKIDREEVLRAAMEEEVGHEGKGYAITHERVAEHFAEADANADGSLDKSEAGQFLSLLTDDVVTKAAHAELTAHSDEDEVEAHGLEVVAEMFKEDVVGHEQQHDYAMSAEDVAEHFSLADVNGDRSLDWDEAEEFLEQLTDEALLRAGRSDLPQQRDASELQQHDVNVVADLFRELDENVDGKIDNEEVRRAAAQHEAGFAEELEGHFALADADADGSMDREEAEHFLKSLVDHAHLDSADLEEVDEMSPAGMHDVVAEMFRELDENVDGKIEKEEVMRVAREDALEGTQDSTPDHIEAHFAVADSNGDGSLDRVEAEAFLRHLTDHVVAEVEGSKAEGHDVVEEDDELDLDEEEHFDDMAEVFRELDANADGKIDRNEVFQAARDVDAGAGDGHEDQTFLKQVAGHFDEADANGDGSLDRDEAAQFREYVTESSMLSANGKQEEASEHDAEERAKDEVADLFRELDENADGKIDEAEVMRVAREVDMDAGEGKASAGFFKRLRELFSGADEDGDKTLRGDEAMSFINSLNMLF